MPVKPPPVYRPNNALPVQPKTGPAVYRLQTASLNPARPAAPSVYQPVMSIAPMGKSTAVPHRAPFIPRAQGTGSSFNALPRAESAAQYRSQPLSAQPPAASLLPLGPVLAVQRMTIQSKKGKKGGKGGLGYGDVGGGDQEVNRIALERAGLSKGIKGHKRGTRGSGVSGQTKKETEKFVEERKEVKKEIKDKAKICRAFHKKVNRGKVCRGCGKEVA